MKAIFFAVFIFLAGPQTLYALELKEGDILLQPLQCWSCSLIELQTRSEYSHIGVVIQKSKGVIWVAEALGSVEKRPLQEFLSRTEKGSLVKILRASYVAFNLNEIFKQEFEHLSYDHEFLWNNIDDKGEKLYCSEFVYKLFLKAKMHVPQPSPMLFDRNRKAWERYFHGHVPDGELGLSPQDFNQDQKYSLIGFL